MLSMLLRPVCPFFCFCEVALLAVCLFSFVKAVFLDFFKKTITKSQKRKSEISQKVAKQVGEIINFARFLCTLESFGHIKKVSSCPSSHPPSYPL